MHSPKGWIPSEGNRGNAAVRKRGDQGCAFRFVPRAEEFIFVVRLRAEARSRRETDKFATSQDARNEI